MYTLGGPIANDVVLLGALPAPPPGFGKRSKVLGGVLVAAGTIGAAGAGYHRHWGAAALSALVGIGGLFMLKRSTVNMASLPVATTPDPATQAAAVAAANAEALRQLQEHQAHGEYKVTNDGKQKCSYYNDGRVVCTPVG